MDERSEEGVKCYRSLVGGDGLADRSGDWLGLRDTLGGD